MDTDTATVDAQSAADALVALGMLVVEPHGRRWLMLGAMRGFTHSVEGTWWYGDRFHPRATQLTLVTSQYVLAALDAWELSVIEVDVDPTEPHGISWGPGLVAS